MSDVAGDDRGGRAGPTPGPRLPVAGPLTPAVLGWEVWVVFALSLGQSGVYALVSLLAALTAPKSLASQQAVLNGSAAPGRPWLDLTYQLLGTGFGRDAGGAGRPTC